METPSLLGRLLVLGILLVIVLIGSRWSTLNGGALLGGVLLGYGCAVIADWRFAMPLVAVFLCHLAITRKHQLTGKLDHRLDAVLALAIASLPWVIAADLQLVSISAALAAVSFAMGAHLAMLDTATRTWMKHLTITPLRSTAKGFLIASMPGLIFLWREWERLIAPVAFALVAIWLVTLLFQKIESSYRGHVTGLWIMKGFLALGVSASAFCSP